MKTKVAIFSAALSLVAITLAATFVWNAMAGGENRSSVMHSPRHDYYYDTILDGVTGNVSGDTVYAVGLKIHGFDIVDTAGTSIVTPQYSADGGSTWRNLTAVTLSAGNTQSYEAYEPLLADQIRAVVSSCSSCTVTVHWFGTSK